MKQRTAAVASDQSNPGSTHFSLPFFGEPEIAHFYLPLLDPVRTPNRFEYAVSYVRNSFDDKRPCFLLPSVDGVQHASRFYMVFHQLEIEQDLGSLHAALGLSAATEAALKGDEPVSSGSPSGVKEPVTIVEVIAVLDPESDDPLSDALDEALKSIREFQLYYHLTTQVSLRRLTRKALPQVIPVLRRSFDSSAPVTNLMILHEGGPKAQAAAASELSADELAKLLKSTQRQPVDMFRTSIEMRQEANLSLLNGDYAAASLFCGISAEALLTELILILMWEEATPPERAADLFGTRDNISNDLLDALAARLRGNWGRNGDGPIGQWQKDVADLRNRVAHLGATPSEAEMRAAFDALTALSRFVGDRLLYGQNLFRYSVTVYTYFNDEGIAERNRTNSWNRFAAAKIFPPHASQLFTLWKSEVNRVRYGTAPADPDRTITVLVAYQNGARRWYLVDEQVDLACEVNKPALDPAEEENIKKILGSSEWDVTSIRVPSGTGYLPEDPVWRPSYEVLPMKSIHRWEQCLWQPPCVDASE